jgi:hypothetical protein
MPRFLIIAIFVACTLHVAAAPRVWKNADGSRSIRGEFISHDASGVTILRIPDRKQVTIPLDKLHPDDRAWLNANHPLPGTEPPPPSAVFDRLVFGDKRSDVLQKLTISRFVEPTVAETFFGRTGLNGVFRTREKIGGLNAMLYFDWDENGGLRELTLHTPPLPASDLKDRLIPCWQDFIGLITSLHGKPVNANPKLDLSPLQDGDILGTHLWKLENNASVLLGAARENQSYQVTVRFTTEDIKPIIIPATAPTTASNPP